MLPSIFLASFPKFKDDGSGGERENGPSFEEKRRKRKRRERLRDGLRGMLDVDHRARQVKCMARIIFNDFKQRMFMHQDKVRAFCGLIAEGPPSPEVPLLKFFVHCYPSIRILN